MKLQQHSGKRRLKLKIATRFVGIATLLCGTYIGLNPKMPRFNADKAPIARCDPKSMKAAIVYTGTPERVREGLELLNEHKVCKLLISGVDSKEAQQPLGTFLSHFDVPVPPLSEISTDTSPDTKANAKNSAAWLAKHPEIKDVVLITSSMHMPRSFVLTERALQKRGVHVRLTTLPVYDQIFDWRRPISRHNACYIEAWTVERAKFMATRLGAASLPRGHVHVASARGPISPANRHFSKYAEGGPTIH